MILEKDEQEKRAIFKAALKQLIMEDLVELCRDEAPELPDHIHTYTKQQALELLEADSIWTPAVKYADNICISTTDKGQQYYLGGQ